MYDLKHFIESSGQTLALLILFLIVFAETGLLIGFFLPGDSLLFTAGFLASQGYLPIIPLIVILFIAAVIGDSLSYKIGSKYGKRLFHRKDSFFFHKEHLVRANNFYKKHGGKTIILARFMPIIRTFAPVVAGIADMRYPTFLFYNIIGALFWAVGITLLGFFLGNIIPDVDRYLLPIILAIILFSIMPGVYESLKTKKQRQKIYFFIKFAFLKIFKF